MVLSWWDRIINETRLLKLNLVSYFALLGEILSFLVDFWKIPGEFYFWVAKNLVFPGGLRPDSFPKLIVLAIVSSQCLFFLVPLLN